MIAILPYKEILALGKDALNATLIPIRVTRAQKQGEWCIAQLEENIAIKEAQVMEHCAHPELSFDTILALQDDVAIAQRKLKKLRELMGMLFDVGV